MYKRQHIQYISISTDSYQGILDALGKEVSTVQTLHISNNQLFIKIIQFLYFKISTEFLLPIEIKSN